jgi:dihydrofolate reductase
MGNVVYSMDVSLDGFVNSANRSLDWANVDEELHTWFNDRAREASVFVYGRRLYELMASHWPTAEEDPSATPAMLDFARIWKPKPKVVFSTTLKIVDWNTRLVKGDVGEELERLRAEFDGDIDIGGPTLAAQFISRGLVDEYRLVIHPVLLGAGTPFFPELDGSIALRQTETRIFGNGAVYVGYGRS